MNEYIFTLQSCMTFYLLRNKRRYFWEMSVFSYIGRQWSPKPFAYQHSSKYLRKKENHTSLERHEGEKLTDYRIYIFCVNYPFKIYIFFRCLKLTMLALWFVNNWNKKNILRIISGPESWRSFTHVLCDPLHPARAVTSYSTSEEAMLLMFFNEWDPPPIRITITTGCL